MYKSKYQFHLSSTYVKKVRKIANSGAKFYTENDAEHRMFLTGSISFL